MIKRTPEEYAAHRKALHTLLTDYHDRYGSFDANKLVRQYDELYKNFLEGRERVKDFYGAWMWTYAKDDPRRLKFE